MELVTWLCCNRLVYKSLTETLAQETHY